MLKRFQLMLVIWQPARFSDLYLGLLGLLKYIFLSFPRLFHYKMHELSVFRGRMRGHIACPSPVLIACVRIVPLHWQFFFVTVFINESAFDKCLHSGLETSRYLLVSRTLLLFLHSCSELNESPT